MALWDWGSFSFGPFSNGEFLDAGKKRRRGEGRLIHRGGGGAHSEREMERQEWTLRSAHTSVGASTDPLLHSACSETQVTVSVLVFFFNFSSEATR